MCMMHCRAMCARQMLDCGGSGCHDLTIRSDAEDHTSPIYLVRSLYLNVLSAYFRQTDIRSTTYGDAYAWMTKVASY